MHGRWLVVGLIISVALNLFLIGAAAGVVALGVQMARLDGGSPPGALVLASAGLPQPDRHNMRLMLRQAWTEVKGVTDQSRGLRLDAWGALADPQPDPAMIKLKLAQSRQLDLSSRAKVEEKVVDYFVALPPSDRTIFAAGMRRALPPGPPPAAAKP